MDPENPPRPKRKLWFFLGLVAGVLLLPYVAGLSHRQIGRRVMRRASRGGDVAWQRLSPYLERGKARLRQAWDDVVDENLPADFPTRDPEPDGTSDPEPLDDTPANSPG